MNLLDNMEEEEFFIELCRGKNNFNRTGQKIVQMFYCSKRVYTLNSRKQTFWKQAKIRFWGIIPLSSTAGDWTVLKGS